MAAPRPPSSRLPPPSRAGFRRQPVVRLESLKNSRPRAATPTPVRRPSLRSSASITTTTHHHHSKTSTCPNPSCPAPNIVEDEGIKVCSGCGTVVSEANIVSEVTFGESSSGAAIVQGTYVGANQSHGRNYGGTFRRGGGMESREITEQTGNRYIMQLSRALNVPESATKAAGQVFKLAVGLNFIQGRRTKTVAAVCLYVACRRQDGNTVMLIDFADVLMINVFKLGRTYKALLDELRLGGNVFIMNPIDPESLIYRFSKQLEFGSATMQVASEAVRIVQRMNRDWMITGRRPAGICGAALILAARMNNFRRTVREVVYVVKVTELTINQRLNEFKATESGDLTVDQFRTVQLESARDPPAFIQAKEGKKPGRGLKRASETAATEEDGEGVVGKSPPAKRRRRVDADGFAIPDVPIDPAMLRAAEQGRLEGTQQQSPPLDGAAEESKGKRGRPKGSKNFKPPPPTDAELASESALEDEMTALLSSGSTLVNALTAPKEKQEQAHQPSPTPAFLHKQTTSTTTDEVSSVYETEDVPEELLTTPSSPQFARNIPTTHISSSVDIEQEEFDSDPEVLYCLLSPEEVEIKERIWVHENKDYLRTQQAKALKRALAEADAAGIGAANTRRRPRKRRKGRMGDVSYLNGDGDGVGRPSGEGGTSRASTPAEATRLMLERRGFSKKINYRLLEELYDDETDVIKRKESITSEVSDAKNIVDNIEAGTGTREQSLVYEMTNKRQLQQPQQPPDVSDGVMEGISKEPGRGQIYTIGKRVEEETGEQEEEGDDDDDEEEEEGEGEGYDDDDGTIQAAFAGTYFDEGQSDDE